MTTHKLLSCTVCDSPKLEYRTTAKIERRVFGIIRNTLVEGGSEVAIVAIEDESEDDSFNEQDERFFCLDCHHEMTVAEVIAAHNEDEDLIFEFMPKHEFDAYPMYSTQSVEREVNDEDDQANY